MSDKKLDKAINQGLKTAKDALAEKMIHLAQKESVQSVQETVYNVTFTGTFTKDEKLVIAAMAKFFKQGQEATRRLLKPGRVIKSFPDKGPADKLAKMLNSIGLSCKVDMEIIGETGQKETNSLLEKAAFSLADSKTPEIHIPQLSQMTWKHWLIAGVILSLLIGAAVGLWLKPPVVTGNSFATYEASVEKVMTHAPEEQRAALKKAIDTLTGAGFDFHERDTAGGNEEVAAGVVYSRVRGLNAKEILAAAEQDMENRRQLFRQEIAEARQSMEAEIAALAELEKTNGKLKQLIVSEPHFIWDKSPTPELMLTLTNQSDETIGKILFQGYLRTEKGKLLVSEPLIYGTAIGILPRGYKYVTFFPQVESPWSAEEVKQNLRNIKFSVTVENALNTRGEMLGTDLRPARKKIEDAKERISHLEKELAAIKL